MWWSIGSVFQLLVTEKAHISAPNRAGQVTKSTSPPHDLDPDRLPCLGRTTPVELAPIPLQKAYDKNTYNTYHTTTTPTENPITRTNAQALIRIVR